MSIFKNVLLAFTAVFMTVSVVQAGEIKFGVRIAAPRAPGRKPWETVSMGHYQRSLVLAGRGSAILSSRSASAA